MKQMDGGNMSRSMQPRKIEGGQSKTVNSDWETHELLSEVLKQLKIMNLHLSILTDNQINKTEVE